MYATREKSFVTWFIDSQLRLNISSNIGVFYELPLSFLGEDTQKEDILSTHLQTAELLQQAAATVQAHCNGDHAGGGLGSVSGLGGPLRGVIRTAESIAGYNGASSRCLGKAKKIIKDCSDPGRGLFISLPSGRRYRSLKTKTQGLKTSFYP